MSSEVRPTSSFFFREEVTADVATEFRLKSMSVNGRTKFQSIQIIETALGKTLVLDSKTQSALLDEYIYHESLVHPAMLLHPEPKTVFIGGGGELATAREVLKHKSVERVIMVDIDQEVVEFCMEKLPEWGQGCQNDPRLTIVYDDANAYLKNCRETFDVIIMDICDPIEAGPGIVCYFQTFYEMLVQRMSSNGVFVTQAGPGGFLTYRECHSVIRSTVQSVFDHTYSSICEIPSFGSPWTFVLGFNEHKQLNKDFINRDMNGVDKDISSRINGSLRYFDGHGLRSLYYLPKFMRNAIAEEKRIMTEATPVFMY